MNRRAIFTPASLKLNLAKSSVCFWSLALSGRGFGSTATHALDGTTSPANTAPAIGRVAPEGGLYSANLREWFRARQIGDIKAARKVPEDAARDGDVGAAWELGGMYADGGEQSDQRAFEYFRTLTESHAEETADTAPAVFIAQAFVAIGFYYLTGVANDIKPEAARAHQMFSYAASYFGDPDAQCHLGRTYLDASVLQRVRSRRRAGCRTLPARGNISGPSRVRRHAVQGRIRPSRRCAGPDVPDARV
jgi:uncharacterized protein